MKLKENGRIVITLPKVTKLKLKDKGEKVGLKITQFIKMKLTEISKEDKAL